MQETIELNKWSKVQRNIGQPENKFELFIYLTNLINFLWNSPVVILTPITKLFNIVYKQRHKKLGNKLFTISNWRIQFRGTCLLWPHWLELMRITLAINAKKCYNWIPNRCRTRDSLNIDFGIDLMTCIFIAMKTMWNNTGSENTNVCLRFHQITVSRK